VFHPDITGKPLDMTTQTTSVPYVDLNDGNRIPQLGFGVFLVPPEETAQAVGHALQNGYRLIDTAAAYGNEEGVRDAIQASGLDRDEVFITTKLANDNHGRDHARHAFHESLEKLGGDYVDLYLIHWPNPGQDRYVETWETLCALRDEGLVRSIGVSNFKPPHLDRIIEATGVVPVVNQVELHPRFQQPELRRYDSEQGIATEAWAPLGRGQFLDDPVLEEIASAHDHTPAQVVLRWHLQIGNVAIPKSVTPARIEENFRVFDFELSSDEMERLGELDRGERTGPDPDNFPS
jgi:2,5-diketo-D-gluconate reductase A